MTTFREGAEKSEPRIVLSFCGLLVEDDSPLLGDAEWLKEAVDSRSEDEGGDYGAPLLKLSVYPCLTGQEAVDFVKRRSSAIPISQPETQGYAPRREGWHELRILAEGSSWRRDAGETIEAWAARTIRELTRELAAAKRGVVVPDAEKYPCNCMIPPDYIGCDCRNTGDTAAQARAIGWNACREAMLSAAPQQIAAPQVPGRPASVEQTPSPAGAQEDQSAEIFLKEKND